MTPNPMIDFAGSPFFVNDALRPASGIRRATQGAVARRGCPVV